MTLSTLPKGASPRELSQGNNKMSRRILLRRIKIAGHIRKALTSSLELRRVGLNPSFFRSGSSGRSFLDTIMRRQHVQHTIKTPQRISSAIVNSGWRKSLTLLSPGLVSARAAIVRPNISCPWTTIMLGATREADEK